MKKIIATGLLGLSLVSMTPFESNAIVGISTGGTGLVVAGAILGTSCGSALIATGSNNKIVRPLTVVGIPCLAPGAVLGLAFGGDPSYGMVTGAILGAVAGVATGVVLLDEKGTSAKFSEIEVSQAEKLGITLEERDSFNTELDQLNLVLQDIKSKVQNLTDNQEIVALTQTLWAEASESLSSETQLAVAKLGQIL